MPKTAERQLLQSNDCLPKRHEPRTVDSRTRCPEKVGRSSKLKSEYLLHTQACYTSAIRASEATSQREEKHIHGAEHPKTCFTDCHRARPQQQRQLRGFANPKEQRLPSLTAGSGRTMNIPLCSRSIPSRRTFVGYHHRYPTPMARVLGHCYQQRSHTLPPMPHDRTTVQVKL